MKPNRPSKALEEDDVSSDRYGKDNEYLALKDKCFEKRFQGYNYNFAFTAQQNKTRIILEVGMDWKSMQLLALQGHVQERCKLLERPFQIPPRNIGMWQRERYIGRLRAFHVNII